jgi:hypothetical protein|tara:strand:+ start:352 stop:615 length:264 start_codon:yes stop_codon:yes gene_type:complete
MKIIRATDVEVTFEKAPEGRDYKWTTTLRVRVKDHDKTLFQVMTPNKPYMQFLQDGVDTVFHSKKAAIEIIGGKNAMPNLFHDRNSN